MTVNKFRAGFSPEKFGYALYLYIITGPIPPMPDMPPILDMSSSLLFFGSFKSVTMASVVKIMAEMLAAFCKALRTTFVGSKTPALNMSSNVCVFAL